MGGSGENKKGFWGKDYTEFCMKKSFKKSRGKINCGRSHENSHGGKLSWQKIGLCPWKRIIWKNSDWVFTMKMAGEKFPKNVWKGLHLFQSINGFGVIIKKREREGRFFIITKAESLSFSAVFGSTWNLRFFSPRSVNEICITKEQLGTAQRKFTPDRIILKISFITRYFSFIWRVHTMESIQKC